MTAQVNEIVFWSNRNFTTAGEKTSSAGRFVGIEGVVFYMYSDDVACTYIIEVNAPGGWRELCEGTIEKAKLTIVDIGFYIPEARLKITPDSPPGTWKLSATAYGYPLVFKSPNEFCIIGGG